MDPYRAVPDNMKIKRTITLSYRELIEIVKIHLQDNLHDAPEEEFDFTIKAYADPIRTGAQWVEPTNVQAVVEWEEERALF